MYKRQAGPGKGIRHYDLCGEIKICFHKKAGKKSSSFPLFLQVPPRQVFSIGLQVAERADVVGTALDTVLHIIGKGIKKLVCLEMCIRDRELAVFCGNTDMVYGARYLLALDGDTGLTVDCIPELVSIACHPFNRPVVDSKRQAVVQGYGILAPRIVPDLASSMRSAFTRIMCGVGGISSYDASCPELYQDLYGEGIFTGKGLIDIDVYRQLLPKRFEEETVLSHDILEGSLMRTLFVGDVELTDCFPKDGPGFLKRLHRWIRGDFQNMPFLFRKVRFYQDVYKRQVPGRR